MPRSTPEAATAPLRLAAGAQALVVAHARRQFPFEACGVLLSRDGAAADGLVHLALPLPNARHADGGDAARCFAIAPADMARAHRQAREQGLQVSGFFHSHPLGDARPSPADVQGSPPWPGLTQLIVALDERGRVALRAYTPDAELPHWHERAVHTVITAPAPARAASPQARSQEV